MADPIPVFILSYERPLYLWACLDSLYRNTRAPCRFILADNCSRDPGVRRVIDGFRRRGMFYAVHLDERNDPNRLRWLLDRHRDILPEYFAFVESDIVVEGGEPCWLQRLVEIMARRPRLGMLGSLIDTSDFIDPAAAARLQPEMDEKRRNAFIKGSSPERRIHEVPKQEVISPWNPAGRLLLVRTETLDRVAIDRDSKWHENMKREGYETGLATTVVHRHLSLLNFYDYIDYDVEQRDSYFRGMDRSTFLAPAPLGVEGVSGS